MSFKELHLGRTFRPSLKERILPRSMVTPPLLEAVGLAGVSGCLAPNQVEFLFKHGMATYRLPPGDEEEVEDWAVH